MRAIRCLAVVLAWAAVPIAASQPQARNQLQDFLYSIDLASPEIGLLGLDAGDILTQGIRDGAPLQVLDRTLHNLNTPNDQVDGLSTIMAPLLFQTAPLTPFWPPQLARTLPTMAGRGAGPRGVSNDECFGALPLGLGETVSDTTIGMSLDFPPWCRPFRSETPGVWFHIVGDGTRITAATCVPGTDFDTAIAVYCGDCTQLSCIDGNDDAGGACGTASRVSWCSTPGLSYFILVFGSGGDSGNFALQVTGGSLICEESVPCGPCAIPDPPTEPEPICFDNYVDVFNGGCTSPTPAFSPITCGERVVGTSGTYLSDGVEPARDTDWYRLSLPSEQVVTWAVRAEFPVLIGFVSLPCSDFEFYSPPAMAAACEMTSVTQRLPAGDWALFVAPLEFSGVPCGARYEAIAHCAAATRFAVLFSVSRLSQGAVDPDPGLVALGLPFNVKDQATKNQEAGDVFLSLLSFTRAGPIPPNRSIAANNTMVWNQGDSGGGDTELDPDFVSPESAMPIGTPLGGMAAGMAGAPMPPPLRGIQPFFFSVSNNSPSLGFGNGATIFLDLQPAFPGGEVVYATRPQLGLIPGDEIDGLIVFDNGDLIFQPVVDQVLFSLTANSPTAIGLGRSGADIFTSNGVGAPVLYCPFGQLGLLGSDELTMLDWVPCDDILTCALDWGIGFVCPIPGCAGDCNGDCLVDLIDLAILLSQYGSASGGLRANGDINSDGVVDLVDLALLLSSFGSDCNPS